MGQKVNPIGFRLAVNRDWRSRWFASKKEMPEFLHSDIKIRDYVKKKLALAAVAKIVIERAWNSLRVTIHTAQFDGGFKEVLSTAARQGKLDWLDTHFSLAKPFNIWMGVIGGTVMVMSSHGAEQLIVQRVLACRSVADGRKALVLSAVLIFPLFLIFLLVGAMLWVFYQNHPFQIPLPESRPGIKATDYVYPIFMLTAVPNVLKGFLIVAILSAAMSSVSSALTSLASVATMDFVQAMVT